MPPNPVVGVSPAFVHASQFQSSVAPAVGLIVLDSVQAVADESNRHAPVQRDCAVTHCCESFLLKLKLGWSDGEVDVVAILVVCYLATGGNLLGLSVDPSEQGMVVAGERDRWRNRDQHSPVVLQGDLAPVVGVVNGSGERTGLVVVVRPFQLVAHLAEELQEVVHRVNLCIVSEWPCG